MNVNASLNSLKVREFNIVPENNKFIRRLDIDILKEYGDRNKIVSYKIYNMITDYKTVEYEYVLGIAFGRKAIIVVRKEFINKNCFYEISECILLTDEEISELKEAGFTQLWQERKEVIPLFSKKRYSSVKDLLLSSIIEDPKTEEERNFNKEATDVIQIIDAYELEDNQSRTTVLRWRKNQL